MLKARVTLTDLWLNVCWSIRLRSGLQVEILPEKVFPCVVRSTKANTSKE